MITPSSGQYNIRSGPYSKVLVASITEDGIDITNKIHDYSWRCYLGDEDITGQLTPEYDDNKIYEFNSFASNPIKIFYVWQG